jgi:hypothetical protein
MPQATVFSMFEGASVERLNFRHSRGETILPGELADVLKQDPQSVPDPVLREYLIRALGGDLVRPRGRPSSSLSALQCLAAEVMIDLCAETIREDIASGEMKRGRGDPEPRVLAADHVARVFGNFTGRRLSNQISSMKNRDNKNRDNDVSA